MDAHARRLTFDRDPDRYDRVRPVFPDLLFESLFELLPSSPRIIEVGPGTGQATQALVARGAHVTAVEIGDHLASFLSNRFPAGQVTVVNEAFEDIDLPAGHWDAVFSANAYHWVDEEYRIAQPARLLQSGGVIATMDFVQFRSPYDRGYFERVQPIYDAYDQGRPHSRDLPEFDQAQPVLLPQLESSAEFSSLRTTRLRFDHALSLTEYQDLLLTYSNMQAMNEPERTSLIDELLAVVKSEFEGRVTIPLAAVMITASRL